MFELAIFLFAVSFSLYLWGLVRTAIWVIPTVFLREMAPLFSATWISFWLAASFLFDHKGGSFDIRRSARERWIVVYFCSGVLTGTLLYPVHLIAFAAGSLLPLVFFNLFKLFRHPASEVIFLPRKIRWLLLVAYLVAGGLRFVEIKLQALP